MEEHGTHEQPKNTVALPSPTMWPIVLALGATLMSAGLVTTFGITALGIALTVVACAGWFRQVLPHEKHEYVPLEAFEFQPKTVHVQTSHLELGDTHRAHLPLETPSLRAGLDGGLAGAVAMAALALLYGLLKPPHSIWYPINLLAGGIVPSWSHNTTEQLAAFSMKGLLLAIVMHVVTSVLVGLLYGALLPMFPRRPIFSAGFLAPLLWTGLLYSTIDVVNPLLNSRIDWGWFIASQVAFGLVAGYVVNLHTNVRTRQYLPFSVRMGLETPGMMKENEERNP